MKIDTTALYQYLNLRYVPSPQYIIKGIRSDQRELLQKPYHLPVLQMPQASLATAVKHNIKNAVGHEVESIPDANKVGVFVSGGIDSTIMLHNLLQCTDKTIHTFTMGFGEDTDELDDARAITDYYGTEHHEIIVTDVLKDFSKIIDLINMPRRNVWGYYLATFASKYVDTVFNGLGGDELFGGYTFRYEHAFARAHNTPRQRVDAYVRAAHPRDFIPRCKIFGDMFKECTKDTVYNVFAGYFDNDLPFMEQILTADLNVKCAYDFMPLFRLDEIAGLDTRVPLLSYDLIKFAATIPHEFKYRDGTGKYILKNAFAGEIPDAAILKKKQGFGMSPLTVWQNGLRTCVEDDLVDGHAVQDGYINKEYLLDVLSVKDGNGMIPHYNKVWDVLAFEIWYSTYLQGELT